MKETKQFLCCFCSLQGCQGLLEPTAAIISQEAAVCSRKVISLPQKPFHTNKVIRMIENHQLSQYAHG